MIKNDDNASMHCGGDIWMTSQWCRYNPELTVQHKKSCSCKSSRKETQFVQEI